MNAERLTALVGRFARGRVVVAGDVVVDEYLYGRTQRVSREAPVLIVRALDRDLRPGGAANAAANLASLGARVSLVGLIGDDQMGRDLVEQLRERCVRVGGLVRLRGGSTTSKTRILAGDLHTTQQQVLRLDRDCEPPSSEIATRLVDRLRAALRSAKGLLLSDYGGGVVHPAMVAVARKAANEGCSVCADSRHNIADYRGIPWVTPNEPEAALAAGMEIEDVPTVRRAGRRLLRMTRGRGALVTRGARGVALFEAGKRARLFDAFGGIEVADVTGAGDTVAAIFLLALTCGATPEEAAVLSNLGGGLVVAKRGTATLQPDELIGAVRDWTGGLH